MAIMEVLTDVPQATKSRDLLTIGGKTFRSRLMLGTGKYRNAEEMNAALEASGCEIVTVALRRIDLDAPQRTILDEIDWQRYHILPNTAGARTADEAIRTARLARAMGLSDWIKVEVIPDPKYLLPDPVGTFEACKMLVDEGFIVLPYINADPALARRLAGDRDAHRHAAGLAHRQRAGDEDARADPDHYRAGDGAGRRGRRHRRPVRGVGGDGTGRGCCLINTAIARAQTPPRWRGHADGRGGGPPGVSSRAGCPSCPTPAPAARRKASCGESPAAALSDAGHGAVAAPAGDRRARPSRAAWTSCSGGKSGARAWATTAPTRDLVAALKERAPLVVNGNWETRGGPGRAPHPPAGEVTAHRRRAPPDRGSGRWSASPSTPSTAPSRPRSRARIISSPGRSSPRRATRTIAPPGWTFCGRSARRSPFPSSPSAG